MNVRPAAVGTPSTVSAPPQAPPAQAPTEPRDRVELGDHKDSLGLRLARTGAGVVGAATGAVIGAGLGAVKGAGQDRCHLPGAVHRALRVAGAVAGLVAGAAIGLAAGPFAVVAGLMVGPLVGAIAGGAAGGALEGLGTAGHGSVDGGVTGLRKGYDIGRTVVDKLAADPKQETPGAPKPAPPKTQA